MHVTGLKQAGGERVCKVVSRVGPSGKIFRRISYSSSYARVPPPSLYCVPALFSFQFFFSLLFINPFSCSSPTSLATHSPSLVFPQSGYANSNILIITNSTNRNHGRRRRNRPHNCVCKLLQRNLELLLHHRVAGPAQ